jgi:hypothetical protein
VGALHHALDLSARLLGLFGQRGDELAYVLAVAVIEDKQPGDLAQVRREDSDEVDPLVYGLLVARGVLGDGPQVAQRETQVHHPPGDRVIGGERLAHLEDDPGHGSYAS